MSRAFLTGVVVGVEEAEFVVVVIVVDSLRQKACFQDATVLAECKRGPIFMKYGGFLDLSTSPYLMPYATKLNIMFNLRESARNCFAFGKSPMQ